MKHKKIVGPNACFIFPITLKYLKERDLKRKIKWHKDEKINHIGDLNLQSYH